MGKDPPKSFNRKDSLILMRGLLPEINIESEELEIRRKILATLHNNCQNG